VSIESLREQPFVPVDHWPDLSAMVESFGERVLPPTQALAGRTVTLRFDNGWVIDHEFLDAGQLRWTILDGDGAGQTAKETYTAIEARPGIFIIDFLKNRETAPEDATIVLDIASEQATMAISNLVDRDGETRTATTFSHATIGDAARAPHALSSGLVGKRMYYRYSERDHYEHVYLNRGTFTWHCIRGAEQGLADTEPTRTYEIAEDLYLFFWTETIMPVEAVLLIDLRHMRSVGRMFGWDPAPNQLVHLPFSSRATLLNATTYPDE
jgi:hypothetical protein